MYRNKYNQKNVCPYKIIDIPTIVTYKLEDFSCKQMFRHRSKIVLYCPNEQFVQEQTEKFFSDNSLWRHNPQKPTTTKSKYASFNLDKPKLPPNTSDSSPNHNIISLDYPILTRKTAILELAAYENNRQNTTESLYHSLIFRLYKRQVFKEHIHQYKHI